MKKRDAVNMSIEQMDAQQRKIEANRKKDEFDEKKSKARPSLLKRVAAGLIERINIVLGFYGMEQIKAEDAFYRIYVSIQNRKDESELNKKRQEIWYSAGDKVTEILATLELGGTKEDLDKMLNEIKF